MPMTRTKALARALQKALALAEAQGYTLLVWDAYRPARAVRRFLRWAGEPEDYRTKDAHYPNIQKTDIVPLGYVATESSHSRGSRKHAWSNSRSPPSFSHQSARLNPSTNPSRSATRPASARG